MKLSASSSKLQLSFLLSCTHTPTKQHVQSSYLSFFPLISEAGIQISRFGAFQMNEPASWQRSEGNKICNRIPKLATLQLISGQLFLKVLCAKFRLTVCAAGKAKKEAESNNERKLQIEKMNFEKLDQLIFFRPSKQLYFV